MGANYVASFLTNDAKASGKIIGASGKASAGDGTYSTLFGSCICTLYFFALLKRIFAEKLNTETRNLQWNCVANKSIKVLYAKNVTLWPGLFEYFSNCFISISPVTCSLPACFDSNAVFPLSVMPSD